jgi:hypothetical protein
LYIDTWHIQSFDDIRNISEVQEKTAREVGLVFQGCTYQLQPDNTFVRKTNGQLSFKEVVVDVFKHRIGNGTTIPMAEQLRKALPPRLRLWEPENPLLEIENKLTDALVKQELVKRLRDFPDYVETTGVSRKQYVSTYSYFSYLAMQMIHGAVELNPQKIADLEHISMQFHTAMKAGMQVNFEKYIRVFFPVDFNSPEFKAHCEEVRKKYEANREPSDGQSLELHQSLHRLHQLQPDQLFQLDQLLQLRPPPEPPQPRQMTELIPVEADIEIPVVSEENVNLQNAPAILGVPENASRREIEKVYKEYVDAFNLNESAASINLQFKRIKDAYELLISRL